MPLSEPKIVTRDPQAYAAIRLTVEQPRIGEVAPPLHDDVMTWLKGKGLEATGAPFFNYTRMQGMMMDMEVGWPIAEIVPGGDRVVTGTLPGGRYLTATYTGPYTGLYEGHEQLHQWAQKQHLPPQDMEQGGLTLLEIYETDPVAEPDPSKWVTEIAFKLSD